MSSQLVHVLSRPIGPRNHTWGPVDAELSLVEYGDYECPFCGAAHPLTKQLKEYYGDRLCFVYRQFPLANAHPHTLHAAEAAEAAAAQNKFWEMHDLLFENQTALQDEMLLYYATQLGLNVKQFVTDLTSNAHLDRIREDLSSGARSGVNGTPTFFANGNRHDGSVDLRSLVAALEIG